MSLYKQFQTDTKIETEGLWLEYGFLDGDETKPIRIKIARAGGANKTFAKLLEAKTKPFRHQIATKSLDENMAKKVMIETFAEAIVLGWENVADEKGNLLPFTVENVKKVFSDLPDLYEDVRTQANNAQLFRAEIMEQDAKN